MKLGSTRPTTVQERCVICIDLDCFFAQVLLKDRPDLAGQPVGIKQKYIIVTCNYEARALGITKLMLIEDALKVKPDLVMLDGSDVGPFREAGKAFFNLTRATLGTNVALERKGFDEIYADITDSCLALLEEKQQSFQLPKFIGHVFPSDDSASIEEGRKIDILKCGSEIASEVRREIKTRLGYRSCAGVGSSKLEAKLASNINKPNDQTTFLNFHPAAHEYFAELSLRALPGFGFASRKLLKENGLANDVRTCGDLVKKFTADSLSSILRIDISAAQDLLDMSRGVDRRPVEPMDVLTKQISKEETRLPHPTTMHALSERVSELSPPIYELMQTRFEESLEWPLTVRLSIKFRSENGRRSKSKTHTEQISEESVLARLASDLLKEMLVPLPFAASHVTLCVTDFRTQGHIAASNINPKTIDSASGDPHSRKRLDSFFTMKTHGLTKRSRVAVDKNDEEYLHDSNITIYDDEEENDIE